MAIIAIAPNGAESSSFQDDNGISVCEQAGSGHWTLHRKADNGFLGIVPKTWALKWEYPDGGAAK